MHEDIIEFRLPIYQLITFISVISSVITFTANIMQVKDFRKAL